MSSSRPLPFSSSPWSPPPWIFLLPPSSDPRFLRLLPITPSRRSSRSSQSSWFPVSSVAPDRRPTRFPRRFRSPHPPSFPDSGLLAILRVLLIASIRGFHVVARTAACLILLGAPDLYLSVSLLLHPSPSPAFLPLSPFPFWLLISPSSFPADPPSPLSGFHPVLLDLVAAPPSSPPAVPVISVPGPRLRHSDLPISCSRPACLSSRFFDSGDPPDPSHRPDFVPGLFRLLPDPRSRLPSSLRFRPSPVFLALRLFPPIRPFVSRTDGLDLVARPRRVSRRSSHLRFDLRPRHSDPSISRSRCAWLYSRFFDLGDRPDPSHRSDLVSGLLPVSSSISDLVFRPSLLSTLSCLPCSAAFSLRSVLSLPAPTAPFPRARPFSPDIITRCSSAILDPSISSCSRARLTSRLPVSADSSDPLHRRLVARPLSPDPSISICSRARLTS